MIRVHIIGGKNHGKTTLVVDLVAEMTRRGIRVATIKHTHHDHEFDTPGKDSHRHRTAGATRVGILSPKLNACFWLPDTERVGEDHHNRYAVFETTFADCDWILVEGDSETSAPKIEVWRADVGGRPKVQDDSSIRLLVTDDEFAGPCSVIARSNVAALVDWILDLSV